jgi:Ca2+-binding RTX toxin-like protein
VVLKRRQSLFAFLVALASCALVPAMQAGAQQELPSCFGETPTIVGTPGNDHIRGTRGPDVIQTLGGNDVVHGFGGDDIICGDTGHDKLFGGKGDDTLHKESGGALMKGGPGDDRVFGGLGDDRMYGGPGIDYMLGGNSDEEDFHPGRDRMYGGPDHDFMDGGLGSDRMFGGPGDDTVQGGVGNGSDRVSGGPGDDEVSGSFGDDRLFGGPGNDKFFPNEGNDQVSGGPGNDRVQDAQGDDVITGGPGDDQLDGGEDDDVLYGGDGNDHLLGGPGNDRLFGGPGDDLLDGGPGEDLFNGGPGQNTIVDEPPPPPPNATLAQLIDLNSRTGIRDWAASRTIATIDNEVAALDQAHRDKLPEVIIDTNATGEPRDKMLRVMHAVLGVPELGFYTEIWSYTFVELTGGGFFGTCNHLLLSPDAWGGLSDADARSVLMHETFHSFNCVNGGPAGALNEGSAIWITNAPFTAPLLPGQSFAEATYGTKLYYRDLNNQPDYPLEAASNPTQKLIDVYNYMSAHDPSQLPWNSNDRLVTCFNRYFVDLNRNVDFYNEWLPAVKQRTDQMLTDPECKPL